MNFHINYDVSVRFHTYYSHLTNGITVKYLINGKEQGSISTVLIALNQERGKTFRRGSVDRIFVGKLN